MATTDRDSSSDLGSKTVRGDDSRPREVSSDGEPILLEGDGLGCVCPDCGDAMSIRPWLMVADCWQCGTSVELTEAQQDQVQRRLADRQKLHEETRQAASAITPTMLRKAAPRPKTGPSPVPSSAGQRARLAQPPPTPPQRRPAMPAEAPHGVRARIRQLYERGWAGLLWSGLSRDLPAWLISLVVHLVAILLLGIWFEASPDEQPSIKLSTAVSDEDLDEELAWELGDSEDSLEAFEFEDAVVPEVSLPADLEALGSADVELEGMGEMISQPPGLIPDFKEMIASSAPALRGGMFVGRDPGRRAQMLQRGGGTPLTEAAVARGLQWMARHQNANGSWSLHAFHKAPGGDGTCDGRARRASDTAGTALGLLPFLGAGQTHYDGDYQDVVGKGLYWLLGRQAEDGDLRDHDGFGRMYAHAQAAIVLCEAYAMTGEQQLRGPAQKALDFIVAAQHKEGGWRYSPGQAGDTSVVGWQLMALQSGRMYYLNVPRRTFSSATRFLNRVQADRYGGRYVYMPRSPSTVTMTAEALLCRLYLGWPVSHPGVESGVEYLLRALPNEDSPNIYYWYYATQVMHHVGGDAWTKWNAAMRSVVVDMQESRGHAAGSWAPRGGHASSGGRLYMTSLAICTLEVYYRHMPLNRAGAVAQFDTLDEPE